MESLLLVLVVVLAGAVVLLAMRQRPVVTGSGTEVEGGPDIAELVRQAAAPLIEDALRAANVQAARDREDALRLAATTIAEKGGEQLGQRAELIDKSIKTVQEDVSARIRELDEELKKLREVNAKDYGNVDNALRELTKNTTKLNEVLSSAQARGQWGERMAEDILRALGFIEGVNYDKQTTIDGGGRPDFKFMLPPDRVLYMDVKFPIDAYARYVEATDPAVRTTMKNDFVKAVRARAKELEKRDYVLKTKENVLEYVLLFVPNESINGFIHEADPELIGWALSMNVVLCSPLNLYTFLSVIRQATDSFHTEKTAVQMVQLISKFRDQWVKYVKELDTLRKNFDKVAEGFDSLTSGTRYKGLERETRKIDELRRTSNIAALPAGDDADIIDADIEEDE